MLCLFVRAKPAGLRCRHNGLDTATIGCSQPSDKGHIVWVNDPKGSISRTRERMEAQDAQTGGF